MGSSDKEPRFREVTGAGPTPVWLVPLWKEIRTQTGTGRRPCEDTGRRRPSTCQAERPQKNQLWQHLPLGLPASRTWMTNICYWSCPVCGALLWQPQQPNMSTSSLILNENIRSDFSFFVSFSSLLFFLNKSLSVVPSRQYLAVLGEENILQVIFQNLNVNLSSTRKKFFFPGVYLEELILKFPSLT